MQRGIELPKEGSHTVTCIYVLAHFVVGQGHCCVMNTT